MLITPTFHAVRNSPEDMKANSLRSMSYEARVTTNGTTYTVGMGFADAQAANDRATSIARSIEAELERVVTEYMKAHDYPKI